MAYGIYVLHCDCGWKTLQKKNQSQPTVCEACNKGGTAEFTSEVAAMIATVVDLRSQRTWDHANKHGIMVFQISPRKYIVLEKDAAYAVGYGDNAKRSYVALKKIGEGNYQQAMKIVRDKTPELPGYLKD